MERQNERPKKCVCLTMEFLAKELDMVIGGCIFIKRGKKLDGCDDCMSGKNRKRSWECWIDNFSILH